MLPRLRAVEVFPVELEGQSMLCLRDPQGIAAQPIFLNNVLTFLVSRMDGSNSLRDIQADFLRASGQILPMEELDGVVQQLENLRFLDSPSFQSFYAGLVEDFRRHPVRPAQHAGGAYDSDPEGLRGQLRGYFDHSDGPGPERSSGADRHLQGLIAPHIDFHRGGPAYGHAYGVLRQVPAPDRFIIFGTCHNPMSQRFALTEKDFETPLGRVATDQEFVRRLAARLEKDYFLDEFAHRAEHSIELQTVCLKYVMEDSHQFKIVPVLVGSFHDLFASGQSVADNVEIQAMAEAIRTTMNEMPGRYCVVAGADLAHVGRRFGDASGPTPESLHQVEREDREFLNRVEAGDAQAVFESIAADHDQRRVCGYPPIYMTLRCLDQAEGELLQYRQWADLEAGAAVTYASVALFGTRTAAPE